MKITIKPTTDQSDFSAESQNFSVSIKHPSDDVPISEVIEMMRGALVAYGFSRKTVDEYIQKA